MNFTINRVISDIYKYEEGQILEKEKKLNTTENKIEINVRKIDDLKINGLKIKKNNNPLENDFMIYHWPWII
tara:strand:- start:806 stop:1021 length:216 start_codon:yes stop_codon:yes gene_type:complete